MVILASMWLLRILLLSIFAVGCIPLGPPPRDGGSIEVSGREIYWERDDFPLWVVIDDQLPLEHVAATLVAIDSWNTAVGAEVFKPVVRDHSLPAPRTYGYVSVSMKELGTNSNNGNRLLGLARAVLHRGTSHMQASEVWFDLDVSEELLLLVMVHELGHALTLEHDNDCTSVMHPTVVNCGDIPFIRPEDIQRMQAMMRGERIVVPDSPDTMNDVLPEVWRHICTH